MPIENERAVDELLLLIPTFTMLFTRGVVINLFVALTEVRAGSETGLHRNTYKAHVGLA